ncbi:MAG: serine/threonine protein kinase [Candidatus Wallbacteria bacterium]|nr:serine/threonine protein kinase [Candidatus Wallbacteria bacterium]
MPAKPIAFGPELARRYEPETAIGEGGMGVVIRARDRTLGRRVAIKFLDARLARDPVAMERFRREAKAMAGLSHPNVVAVFDHGLSEGIPYAVYELVDGVDLRHWLAEHARMEPAQALELACQVLGALEAAHRAGIVHRDIKPDNVLLAGGSTAKVADFGIARLCAEEQLTSEGVVLGTPGYVAPEQFLGKAADARADVYSVAALLYELLSGAPPFHAPDPAGILARQAEGPPEPLDSRVNFLPPGLAALLSRALDPKPQARPQSARDMAQALQEMLAARPAAGPVPTRELAAPIRTRKSGRAPAATVQISKPSVPAVRQGWSRRALAGAGAVILLGLAGFATRPSASPPPPPAGTGLESSADTTRAAPAPAAGPPVTAVARELAVQCSEDRIRVRFLTARPARARLTARPEKAGPMRQSTLGEPASEHDLTVEDLLPDTAYALKLDGPGPGEPLVAAHPIPPQRTRPRGFVQRLVKDMLALKTDVAGYMMKSFKWQIKDFPRTGDPRLADALIALAKESAGSKRLQCLDVVGRLATPRQEKFFLDLLAPALARGDADEFSLACQTLNAIGGPATARVALELAASRPERKDPYGEWLLALLGRLARRWPAVADLLAEAAAAGEGRRRAALDALVEAPGTARGRDLLGLLRKQDRRPLRVRVLRWAAGTPGALAPLLPAALADPERQVHELAAELAGLCPEAAPAGPIAELAAGRFGQRSPTALRVLGSMGASATRTEVEAVLADPDESTRACAALALAESNATGSLPKVLSLLTPGTTQPPEVWLAAGCLAGAAGAPAPERRRARGLLLEEARRERSPARWAAVWALGRAGDAQDTALLERLALDGTEPARLRAFEALWSLDRAKCARLIDVVLAGRQKLAPELEEQLSALRSLPADRSIRMRLFAPRDLPAQLLAPEIAAGEGLQVEATGWLVPGPQAPSGALQIREGSVQRALGGGTGLALDSGPLAVAAPAATSGWCTVYWYRP